MMTSQMSEEEEKRQEEMRPILMLDMKLQLYEDIQKEYPGITIQGVLNALRRVYTKWPIHPDSTAERQEE